MYGRGSQLNGGMVRVRARERREGQPRSTSTAASDSVASRASSRRLVESPGGARTVVRLVTRLVFLFSFFVARGSRRMLLVVAALRSGDSLVTWCSSGFSAIRHRKCSLMHGFVRE